VTKAEWLTSRLRWALVALAALVLKSAQAEASPVLVQVDYLTTSGQNCIRAFCFPLTPGGTFQKTFALDSAQIAIDGTYDVSASLAPAFVFPPGTSSSALSVLAVVLGGTVSDLGIHFYASGSVTVPILGTTFSSQAFDALAGAWSSSSSSSNSLSNSSGNAAGSYSITVVPEPGTLALACFGLLGVALRSRR
jgi:hypothetical protein